MTDITELAQSLKRRAASANEFGEGLFFIKADDVLALVEALEKAQTKAIEQGRTACELFDEVTVLRQRIADLESRTVKLPEPEQWDITQVLLCKKKVVAAIRAAGIKVEVE
ncbi:TPA: hypothetical protein ACQ7HE_001954 [Klebsiella pneumoniae]